MSVPADEMSSVLLAEKWPTHVSIKKYYQLRGKVEPKPVRHVSGDANRLTRSVSVGHVAG